MKPELYQQISLTRDVPSAKLKRGDVATVVDYVAHPGGEEDGAILEVFNAIGESVAVLTVPVSAIAALSADQMPTVRPPQVA